MPSTVSPRLRTEQQALGENLNSWGFPKLNDVLLRLEEAIADVVPLTITGNYTPTSNNYVADEARGAVFNLTGSPAAPFTLTLPAVEKTYWVRNATGQNATLKTASGAGAVARPGQLTFLFCDGSTFYADDPTLDQIKTAATSVSLGGQKITNLINGTASTDAATVGQIPTLVEPYATAASNSATAAATSASNASTSASNAATSASTASTAASTALTALDSFDDRYLGAKSSNPTLDNDGNALLVGALYWNSSAQEMRVWTGSAWVAAYNPSTSAVSGPATATNNAIALFNGTSGKILKDSAIVIGTGAGNVVQLDGSARLPAVNGSLLTNVASAAAAPWTQIASVTISGTPSTVDFNSIPQTYVELLLVGTDFATSGSGSSISASTNGSTYSSGGATFSNFGASVSGCAIAGISNYTKDIALVSAAYSLSLSSPGVATVASNTSAISRCTGGVKYLRILPSGGGTFSAGTFTLFAR